MKKINVTLSQTTYKINFKWIISLSIKGKTIKLLEKNIGKKSMSP